tara:strand:- start:26 stop:1036 length:1011 start_codon:yes stop_codon:yes gene_type:complete
MIRAVNFSAIMSDGSSRRQASIDIDELSNKISDSLTSWSEFIVDDVTTGADEVVKKFGITLSPTELLSGYYSNYEDRGDVLGLMMPVLTLSSGETKASPVLIYLKQGQVITIHDERTERLIVLSNYAEVFMRKLPGGKEDWADRQTLIAARIIDEIVEHNFEILRLIVERAEQLQIELGEMQQLPRDTAREMSNIKRWILDFLNAVWGARTTVHMLRYGDAEMITDKEELLSRFELILAELDRKIQMTEQVSEVLTAGMNVIQAEIQNKLATIVVWLTVVATAFLVPNTLATIYGLLPINEVSRLWMVISLIFATVTSAFLAYWYAWRWWHRKGIS